MLWRRWTSTAILYFLGSHKESLEQDTVPLSTLWRHERGPTQLSPRLLIAVVLDHLWVTVSSQGWKGWSFFPYSMKINKHNFAKAFWHHCCLFLYWALHLAFPTYLLCFNAFPSLFLKQCHFSAWRLLLVSFFNHLGLYPTSAGARMGSFNTWRVLPTASHLVSALTSAGSGWCRAVALLASPPTPAWCWLGSHLTVDFSLQILRKWRIRAKIVGIW